MPASVPPAADTAVAPTSSKASLPLAGHGVIDDIQGLLLATLVSSLGLAVLAHDNLLVGGMAGLSLLLHYAFDWPFSVVFVLGNLPFYWLSVRRMGWEFTLKTFAAVAACGALTDLLPRWIDITFSGDSALMSAVIGGCLTGLGILFFVRHRASLGGIGILAIYLQQSRGWNAGLFQLCYDLVLMAVALLVLPASNVAYSVIAALLIGMVLGFNHRPGRYQGRC
ncbi:YitT family protein [Stenotrophomonas ginsengisoli]|uniref:YitT family protein n=1 Tax=Stenotrophomonas ginsengisoli TaxID=336566 RepID=UPI00070ED6BF|nr:YitT family protein [Stenotrophomonas ginsengisoli]